MASFVYLRHLGLGYLGNLCRYHSAQRYYYRVGSQEASITDSHMIPQVIATFLVIVDSLHTAFCMEAES